MLTTLKFLFPMWLLLKNLNMFIKFLNEHLSLETDSYFRLEMSKTELFILSPTFSSQIGPTWKFCLSSVFANPTNSSTS